MNNNQGCNMELITALIGIGGTILGTVLGWLLSIITQIGRLKFYSHISGMPHKVDGYGSYMDCGKLEEADSYTCYIDLDIFNNNSNYKTIKDIKIRFMSETDSFCKTPTIEDITSKNNGKRMTTINIPPKQTVSLRLSSYFSKDSFYSLKKTTRVDLEYNDEKDKKKVVRITKNFLVAETNDEC